MGIKKVNGVLFKGQYLENLKKLNKGKTITHKDFGLGTYHTAIKFEFFTNLLDKANIKYNKQGTNFSNLKIVRVKKQKSQLEILIFTIIQIFLACVVGWIIGKILAFLY